MTVPLYNLTDTWNNALTAFDAIKMNVTDTGHAAASTLINLQIGGVTQFSVSPSGAITALNFTSSTQGLTPSSGGGTTNFLRADGTWAVPAYPVGANPSTTASDTAHNGSATTFMRSDATPAIQLTSASVFGLCKVDGTSITATAGVISATGGGGGSPGGANTDVQFNSGGSSFGGDSGFTYAGNGKATLTLGTITADAQAISASATWNNSGVNFSGGAISASVTNTASGPGGNASSVFRSNSSTPTGGTVNGYSYFIGGTRVWAIGDDGNMRFATSGTVSGWSPTITGLSTIILTTVEDVGNASSIYLSGAAGGFSNGGYGLGIGQNSHVGFSDADNNAQNTAHHDVALIRDTASILGVLNYKSETTAAAMRIYGTTDVSTSPAGGPTNYERLSLVTGSSAQRIQSEAGGTGIVRIIAIDGFQKAGAAAASDIPSGTWGLIHDTSGATFKLCYNDAGTLRTVTLT